MTVDYKIEFREEDMARFLELVHQIYRRAMELFSIEMLANMGKEAPVDHGRLAGSFDLNPMDDDLSWRITSDVEYALDVYQGTGVHGPAGVPITPTAGEFLVFEWMGETWFLREVQGQEPNPYIDRAFDSAQIRIDEFTTMAVEEVAGGLGGA